MWIKSSKLHICFSESCLIHMKQFGESVIYPEHHVLIAQETFRVSELSLSDNTWTNMDQLKLMYHQLMAKVNVYLENAIFQNINRPLFGRTIFGRPLFGRPLFWGQGSPAPKSGPTK